MVKKVLKFGGTSVGSIDRIQHVAGIIKREFEAGNQVIAIVSAMSGKTNDLINMSKNISDNFDKRELDVLLSTGEQVSSSLLAGALINSDVKARTWLNWQIPILTEGEHSNSRIITTEYIKHYEYFDSDGQRRVRKVTEKKTYFDSDEQRHNPACSTSVEIL